MGDCALITGEERRPRRSLRQRCTSIVVEVARVPRGSLSGLSGVARSCDIQCAQSTVTTSGG